MLGVVVAAIATGILGQDQKPVERRHSLALEVVRHESFASQVLGNKRTVWVCLPPGYARESGRRFPVLYMHDGQNVFDGFTAFIPNQEWRADETLKATVEAGLVEPLIIVGIDNGGVARGDEYLPTRAKMGKEEAGGKADLYTKFVVDEVMPFVNKTYRTKTGPGDTGLCGSSFGGVVTFHMGMARPDVFGKLAVVSPSLWWDGKVMVKRAEALTKKPWQRMWLDIGTREGNANLDTRKLRDIMLAKGWKQPRDFTYYEDVDAQHNEVAWAGRFPSILQYLFPAR
ncbi:MAG: alpha/beta hydrolase [Armatimonadetes bacterium]|nr:alpha/beta hydrolase [Armatimonadota bacterium]